MNWVSVGAITSTVVLMLSRCENTAEPSDAQWWNDGSGGGRFVPLLESLGVEEFSCSATRVDGTSCQFIDNGVTVNVSYRPEQSGADPALMSVHFSGMARGLGSTPDVGDVRLKAGGCFDGVSSRGAPEPCELELQGIVRGEPEEMADGSGGSTTIVEVGSRVRVRVSCPGGLYYPGTDDVGPFVRHIVPSEFALEAQDCVVVE